jgi:AraC-like DNA-binding protein
VGESQESISRHSSTGLFFYSPDNASQAVYQPDERYVLLFVTFTREGLRLLIDSPKIQALLSPEHTFTYFQEVDLHLENIVKQIFGSREALFHKMQLLGQTLLLIEHVLQKSITENPHNLAGFLEEDVLKLFQARELLTVRYGNPPTIVELSHTLGMNETKLKKSFKQVFNTSIYQYSQYARMLKAKELLESRRHTASEVAYLVGYNNLTHFGEAFKKHFQTLPGQYLSSVLQSYT